jgi:hypothetical protein
MPPVGFEPTILVSERPQTYALDRTVTGIGLDNIVYHNIDEAATVTHFFRITGYNILFRINCLK